MSEQVEKIDVEEEAKKFKLLKKNVTIRKKEAGERDQKTRIYIFGPDYSVMENLLNRRCRPYKVWRTFIPDIIELANEKVYGLLNVGCDTKVVWSQKAGCNCGCSPAFILQSEPQGVDIFVELEMK